MKKLLIVMTICIIGKTSFAMDDAKFGQLIERKNALKRGDKVWHPIDRKHYWVSSVAKTADMQTVISYRWLLPGLYYKQITMSSGPHGRTEHSKNKVSMFGIAGVGAVCAGIYAATKYGSDYFSSLSNYLFPGKK